MDAVGGSWVGQFACSVCRRKRLTAESFSGTQLRKLRNQTLAEDKLKCKTCVVQTEDEQRKIADEARLRSPQAVGAPLSCSICKQQLPPTSFSNTQSRKPDDSRKCSECCTAAENAACSARSEAKREAAAAAAKGTSGVAAWAAASAAEAERVTGLKPMVGAGKRGRGRGRGRGTWRGRGR